MKTINHDGPDAGQSVGGGAAEAVSRSTRSLLGYGGVLLRILVLAGSLGFVARGLWIAEIPSGDKPAPVALIGEESTLPEAPHPDAIASPSAEFDESWQRRAAILYWAQAELEASRQTRLAREAESAAAERHVDDYAAEAAHLAHEATELTSEMDRGLNAVEKIREELSQAIGERKALEAELAAIERAPRPRPQPLIDKSPVSRPPRGSEFHFELQGGRIGFIDMDQLLDRLKSDARLQIRMMSAPKPVSGEAGPVGAYAIRYQVVPIGVGMAPGRYGSSLMEAEYTLSGYEIVPTKRVRGETLAQAMEPASDFGRAINRLDPLRDTLTLWVYPDSFELFREVRDLLQQRGFMIAARPLPIDMPIRGSPTGSISAAQ